ncbi:MAG TPA: glycosyltransferase [Candidatus Paceibacterota bacterium]
MMDEYKIYIGYDGREADAFAVARHSINRRLTLPIQCHGIVLSDLRKRGLYLRQTLYQDGGLWDTISGAPMSTEFAISRFFTPLLAARGWALFLDCDFLVRTNLCRLFEALDPQYAVYCVKHDHVPTGITKMDGQTQTKYPCKNWSSFMIFNCEHKKNKALTVEMLNKLPGRDLHRFCWLDDEDIAALGPEWNYLVGYNNREQVPDPMCVHFTHGVPTMPGYEDTEFAEEWRDELEDWAR